MRRRSRLGLTGALIFGLLGPSAASDDGFIGRYAWSQPEPIFGGFSAIEVTPDGQGAIVVSDRGRWTQVRFRRSETGEIDGIEVEQPLVALFAPSGKPLRHTDARDSEGLATTADGRTFVAFEGPARIWEYADPGAIPVALPTPREFAGLPKNSGIEALAADDEGALFAIPEDFATTAAFPVFRYHRGEWAVPFRIGRIGIYLPVGADMGPDGRLYVLERSFSSPLTGFSSRIRRFDPMAAGIQRGEVLLTTSSFRFGDLEGISIWRDAEGRLRATMVGDDNFSSFLSTEFVEYRLPD